MPIIELSDIIGSTVLFKDNIIIKYTGCTFSFFVLSLLLMEVCGPCNTPDSLDIRDINEHFTEPCHLNLNYSRDFSVEDLKNCMKEFLRIQDTKISTDCINQFPGKNASTSTAGEGEQKHFVEKESWCSSSEKCLIKSATYPLLCDPTPFRIGSLCDNIKKEDKMTAEVNESNDLGKSVNCYSRSISLPAPSKLVSALKGSREIQGFTTKKLSVTWAPDVYDPIPTAASHAPSNKNQRSYNDGKKYGKNKQKGGAKSSRASKGKDKKKQVRRSSSANTNLIPLYDDNGMIGYCKPVMGNIELNVKSPDPFCGSSFLKKSVSKLHYSVAEAT